jgi:hypothetical protein
VKEVEVNTYNEKDALRVVPSNTYTLQSGEKTRVKATGSGSKLQLSIGKYVWTLESGAEALIPEVRHTSCAMRMCFLLLTSPR